MCDAAAEELTPVSECDLHCYSFSSCVQCPTSDRVHYLQFTKHNVTTSYKKEEHTYEVHARSMWQWVVDLLNNPHLAPHFVWDAECLYKHNGVEFERFYDKPWMADRQWDIQMSLVMLQPWLGLKALAWAQPERARAWQYLCINISTNIIA